MSSFITLRRFGCALGLGTLLLFSLTHCGEDPGADPKAPDKPDGAVDARRDVKPPQEDAALPPLPPSTTEGGGARFRPEYAEETYEDGSRRRTFTGAFFDTEQNRRCSVVPVGSDRWACLPTGVAWVQQGFRDASCTDPVLFESGAPKQEPYLMWGEPCSWSVGLKKSLPTKGTVYELYDGRCSPRSGVMIHEIPTPIEPSAMGEFTRTSAKSDLPTERSGSRLAVFTDKLVGPDGSFEYQEPVVVDLDRDVEGGFYPGQDGKLHFLPASRWASESLGFVDSTCTEALVNLGSLPPARCGASRPPSTNALELVGDHPIRDCRAARVVGAPTKPVVPTVYLETGGSCSLMPYPGTDTYTKDSFVELPASESPETTRSVVRIDALAIHGAKIEFRAGKNTSPDGLEQTERYVRPFLRDYGVPCEPRLASDGEYRCLPIVATAYGDRYHADEACTQKVRKLEDWTMSCEGDPTLYVVATDDPYGYFYEAYRRPASSPLNQKTYYWLGEDGSCSPAPADPGGHYYAVTAADEPIPPTEFPAVTTDFVVDR